MVRLYLETQEDELPPIMVGPMGDLRLSQHIFSPFFTSPLTFMAVVPTSIMEKGKGDLDITYFLRATGLKMCKVIVHGISINPE